MPASSILPLRGIDPGLAREVSSIRAIDQHAHPVAVGVEPSGDPDCPIQPYEVSLPLRMRPDSPEYLDAWEALWGYQERSWALPQLRNLVDRKQAIIAEQGQNYNVWVLDQLNIKTMIAMAPGPSPSEPSPRFEWCAFAEWFMWPVPVAEVPASAMSKTYRATNDRFTARFNPGGSPATLDHYLESVMERTLDLYKQQGAVGIKFHGPYNRPLNFDEIAVDDARSLYARGHRDGGLPFADHKALQDFLFERLVTSAGNRGFIVQIHTGFGGRENFFTAGSNPLLMERIFHAVRGTNFVLLHGGWPFIKETVALLATDNVYTDFSCAALFQYARSLAGQIRAALEWYPEKLLYGTDAYSELSIAHLNGLPFRANPLAGWEEKAWLMDRTGRTALTLALSEMQDDGEIDHNRAEKFVGMVMSETATRLYALSA